MVSCLGQGRFMYILHGFFWFGHFKFYLSLAGAGLLRVCLSFCGSYLVTHVYPSFKIMERIFQNATRDQECSAVTLIKNHEILQTIHPWSSGHGVTWERSILWGIIKTRQSSLNYALPTREIQGFLLPSFLGGQGKFSIVAQQYYTPGILLYWRLVNKTMFEPTVIDIFFSRQVVRQ